MARAGTAWAILALLFCSTNAEHTSSDWSLIAGCEAGNQLLGDRFEPQGDAERSGASIAAVGYLLEGGWLSTARWWGVDAGIRTRVLYDPFGTYVDVDGSAWEARCVGRWEPFHKGFVSPWLGIGLATWWMASHEMQYAKESGERGVNVVKRDEEGRPVIAGELERGGSGLGFLGLCGLRIGNVEILGTGLLPLALSTRTSIHPVGANWSGRFARDGMGEVQPGFEIRWRQGLRFLDDRD